METSRSLWLQKGYQQHTAGCDRVRKKIPV